MSLNVRYQTEGLQAFSLVSPFNVRTVRLSPVDLSEGRLP